MYDDEGDAVAVAVVDAIYYVYYESVIYLHRMTPKVFLVKIISTTPPQLTTVQYIVKS